MGMRMGIWTWTWIGHRREGLGGQGRERELLLTLLDCRGVIRVAGRLLNVTGRVGGGSMTLLNATVATTMTVNAIGTGIGKGKGRRIGAGIDFVLRLRLFLTNGMGRVVTRNWFFGMSMSSELHAHPTPLARKLLCALLTELSLWPYEFRIGKGRRLFYAKLVLGC
jgi:hypothetical protein